MYLTSPKVKRQRQVDIAGTLTKANLDLVGAPSKGDPVAKPGELLGSRCGVAPVAFPDGDLPPGYHQGTTNQGFDLGD